MIYNVMFIKVPQNSNYINYELSFKFNVMFNGSINKLSNQLIIMFHNRDFSFAYNIGIVVTIIVQPEGQRQGNLYSSRDKHVM